MHEDARAEQAVLSHAEAYRLVEEARQMRAERDAFAGRLAALEAAIMPLVMTRLDDLILPQCILCLEIGHSRQEIEHKMTCPLSALAEQGRAAGEQTAYEMHPELDWSAKCTCPTGWLNANNGWHRGPNACPRYDLDVVRRQHIPAASQPGGADA